MWFCTFFKVSKDFRAQNFLHSMKPLEYAKRFCLFYRVLHSTFFIDGFCRCCAVISMSCSITKKMSILEVVLELISTIRNWVYRTASLPDWNGRYTTKHDSWALWRYLYSLKNSKVWFVGSRYPSRLEVLDLPAFDVAANIQQRNDRKKKLGFYVKRRNQVVA